MKVGCAFIYVFADSVVGEWKEFSGFKKRIFFIVMLRKCSVS